jgi:RHS repeat-associated protein
MEATNDACTVKFERDPAGRIVKEWQDDYWVSSGYDENGFRKEMRSCFGAIQRIERNSMGDVVAIQYNDALKHTSQSSWQTQIQRDSLGLEMERSLPGGIRSRWERDKLGRPIRHQLLRDGAQPSRDVRYQWDVNDQLRRVVDAHRGTTIFEHDAAGNLAAAVYDNGTTELRMPDAVGNLFRTKDRHDRKYGKAGQILESRDENGITTYKYDAEGNLTHKSTPKGDWIYRWTASGMLKSVQRPDGELVHFTYDALGRRISKSFKGRKTRWIWDGNNPLHEWIEGENFAPPPAPTVPTPESTAADSIRQAILANPANGPPPADLQPAPYGLITWLFEPESFAPVAKLTGGERYSIVTDYLGTPCAMLDDAGRTVWSASVSIYGDLRNLVGDRHACPFRWPGQYEDQETGLYYNRFRYYDFSAGVFIRQDPVLLFGGPRLYSYVTDPFASTDVFGLTGPDDGGFSVYGLFERGSEKPYYVGISNDADRRMLEHIESGRLSPDTGSMRVLHTDLNYAQARGHEQALIEHYNTRTGVIGEDISPANRGNKVNSFDKTRTDARGSRFNEEYHKANSKIACG